MTPICAYFDDTGTDANSSFVGIGGCIAPVANWTIFSEDWSDLMDSWDLEWFHMTAAESRREPPYDAWSDKHRHSRVITLARTIQRVAWFNISAVLPRSDFERVLSKPMNQELPEFAKNKTDPYLFLFRHVLNGVEIVARMTKVDKSEIEIVFAEQKGLGHHAKAMFSEQLLEDGFKAPRFENMQRHPPLQAADMVAWFAQQQASTGQPWGSLCRPRHAPLRHRTIFSPKEEWDSKGIAELDTFVQQFIQQWKPHTPPQ